MFAKENIVLIGMPGSGKSRLGRLLAEKLGRPFFDTDEMLEERCGMTIKEIFAGRGEAFFRLRETECIEEAAAGESGVISTGGGAVLGPLNMKRLSERGRVFFIDVSLAALAGRADAATRPLLMGGQAKLEALYAERRPLYLKYCDERLENEGSFEEGLALLLAVCQKPRQIPPGRLLGVVGQPVCHSLSPRIHAALNAFAGLDYGYFTFCASPHDLSHKLSGFKEERVAGFNVTMPHKQAIVPLLDGLRGPGRRIMAVNTVKNENGRFFGYNTDGEGFVLAAAAQGIEMKGKNL
ncbi:MAG: hypothetical protein FWE85_03525, partial [Clostridiales bacterium]|nr:hypothetical protein [Clostridiales bacterium]